MTELFRTRNVCVTWIKPGTLLDPDENLFMPDWHLSIQRDWFNASFLGLEVSVLLDQLPLVGRLFRR